MTTNRRTDMTNLKVTSRNFSNLPKNREKNTFKDKQRKDENVSNTKL